MLQTKLFSTLWKPHLSTQSENQFVILFVRPALKFQIMIYHNLNWYETPPSVTDAVMQMDDDHIIVPLQKVLHKVVQRSNERIYRTKQDMINSVKSVRQHLANAAWWNKLEFISSIAVWVFRALFILSLCCFRRSVVSTILGAKVLEEVEMIKVVPGAKAATIPFPNIPTRQPLDLPTGFGFGHKE